MEIELLAATKIIEQQASTIAALKEQLAGARNAALEQAAKICEWEPDPSRPITTSAYSYFHAAAIRALASQPAAPVQQRTHLQDAIAELNSTANAAPPVQQPDDVRDLPPLPDRDGDWAGDDWYTADSMRDYASAAIAQFKPMSDDELIAHGKAALATTRPTDKLAALIPKFRELNMSNYRPDEVEKLNDWAIAVCEAFEDSATTRPGAAPDSLLTAARNVMDTELGQMACTGSMAPCEDALGRLNDAIEASTRPGAALTDGPDRAMWSLQEFYRDNDTALQVIAECRAILAASGGADQVVPEGMALVPVEATWEMTRPAFAFDLYKVKCDCGQEHGGGLSHNKAAELYAAMIAAAPTIQGEGSGK